jgi:hypothetical protein
VTFTSQHHRNNTEHPVSELNAIGATAVQQVGVVEFGYQRQDTLHFRDLGCFGHSLLKCRSAGSPNCRMVLNPKAAFMPAPPAL